MYELLPGFQLKDNFLMFEELSKGIGQILTHTVITATVINSETPQTPSCELRSCHKRKKHCIQEIILCNV